MLTEDDLRLLAPTIRSRINLSLSHIDRELTNLELKAEGASVHSVLYNDQNDLSPESRDRFMERIRAVREILIKMKTDLKLNSETTSVSNLVWSHCAFLHIDLMDLETKRLRGYGEPPEWLSGYLDPLLQQMIVLLTDAFK